MTKPVVTSYAELAPLIVQHYERYLPSAFDDSLTMLQKLNKVFEYCNQVGLITNGVLKQWNEVMEWVLGDGLYFELNKLLGELVENGTFDNIFNSVVLKGSYILTGSGIDATGQTVSTGVQTFFDNVAQNGGGTIEIPFGLYRFNSNLKIYPEKIKLIASKEVTFQFEQPTGYAIDLIAYQDIYVKDYLELSATKSITGIRFVALSDSLYLVRSKGTTTKFASGWLFKECSFVGGNSVEINTGTWVAGFEKCYFRPKGYGVIMPGGGSNYGEKISINKCVFDNAECAIYNGNGQGDIRITDTSIDYCHTAVEVVRGVVEMDNSFLETSYDEKHQIIVDGYGATFIFGSLVITDTLKTQRQTEFFKVGANTTDLMGGGIHGRVLKLIAGYSSTGLLVNGEGPAVIDKILEYRDGKKPVISRFMNRLAFKTGENQNSLDEWSSIDGSILPTIDNAEKVVGNGSFLFSRQASGITGNVGIRLTTPCRAGQTIRLRFMLKTLGLTGSGLNMSIDRKFLSAKNDPLSTGSMKQYTSDQEFKEEVIVPSINAPIGTEKAEITIWCGNWTPSMKAWVDDIVLNIL